MDTVESGKKRLIQLRAWGYGILTQSESDELKELEALEAGAIIIKAPANLMPAEISYWQQRAKSLFDRPVVIVCFNK